MGARCSWRPALRVNVSIPTLFFLAAEDQGVQAGAGDGDLSASVLGIAQRQAAQAHHLTVQVEGGSLDLPQHLG